MSDTGTEILFGSDLGAALAALDQARVSDFVRFVQRKMREEGSNFTELPFKTGWLT